MVINMQKKTLKFSFYLLLFSFLAKILSFLSRIILARKINALAMSYYTIISPTIVILISIVQMGIPNVLSKLVADKSYNFKILSTSIYFTIFTTTFTTIIYLIMIPFLSHLLFGENIRTLFYTVLPYLPLVALSGLLKGYLMGRQKFISSSFSQIIEEIARISFLLIMFTLFSSMDSIDMARTAILSISVGEAFASIFLLFAIFFDKHRLFKRLEYSKESLKSILNIAIPMSSSRFIGSFAYFLEPIFMSLRLSSVDAKAMMLTYGTLNGYVLPLLTMPSFITITLSGYLLPSFTYYYTRNNKKYATSLFLKISYFCLFVGILYSLLLFFYADKLCILFYGSTIGAEYLKLCSIPFIIYSLQPVLSNMLHALGMSKRSAIDTFIGCVVRLGVVAIFAPTLKSKALVVGLVMGMLVTTIMHLLNLLNKKRKPS